MPKDRQTRELRDQAGVGPDARQVRHLRPLSEMKKVKIASGEPDIRGWSVFTSTGREVGEVQDLLVDPSIGQVVMLDIDIDGSSRRSLAPIRAAWVDRDSNRVVLDAAQIRDDENFPSFARSQSTDEEWNRFDDDYRRTYGAQGFDEEADWQLRHADDELRFSRRPADREPLEENPEYRVERRRAAAAERERAEREAAREEAEREQREREEREAQLNEVHYDARALRKDRPVVIEEHVVRRRVVDQDEIDNP